ncbi:polyadenylate-binding protein, cytoplasmic and nuclear-like isoform X2 [Aristolochia californica]|uniref:polyadenylate-binding protein, cytoplasmic and nuclear-like isoform X2 n=1 Tax=Aristolochia californica TaxID=171875 RepID=UPI0035E099D4
MPPRGRKGAGKKTTPKGKNPSPRTKAQAQANAVEEKSVSDAEVPVVSLQDNTISEPECLPTVVEEKTVAEEEVLVEKKEIEEAYAEEAANVTKETSDTKTEGANAEESANVVTEINEKKAEDRVEVKLETVEVKEMTVTHLVDIHMSESVKEEKDNGVPTEPEEIADGKSETVLEPVNGESDGNISRKTEKMKDCADGITEAPVREGKVVEIVEASEEAAVGPEGPSSKHVEEDNNGEDSEVPEEIMDGHASESAPMERDGDASKEIGDEETLKEDLDSEGGEVDGALQSEGGNKVGDGDESGSDDEEEDEENEEEDEDPSVYMHAPLSDQKKQKEFEIFVGGLDKEAVEEDLTKVFGEFGEIQAARIVKHPTTQKSKGFAFIRYATVEQAKKALLELKDGAEVKGKRVGISASQDNDTLYMGNICKTWTKDHVLETLKAYGVEQIEEIYLPEDPKNEGKSKGFALLEFGTHSDAMTAFQRLRKPDAVFGCDRSARVSFAQSSMHPSEEALSQVKTVYIECLPASWNEEKVKEQCKQYGDIEKIQLSRNFTTARRKDFGFITFMSHESALACVEGINNAEIGEGETKVKANLAKPQNKGRLAKQGARGGFKVRKEGDHTEDAGRSMKARSHAKSKGSEAKGKGVSNFRSGRSGQPLRPHGRSGGQGGGRIQDFQRREPQFKGGKHGGRGGAPDYNPRPSKKARGNMHDRPTNDFGNRRNSRFGKPKGNYPSRPPPYKDSYASRYGAPTPGYPGHGYGATSGSKRQYSDMEPHAGYLGPAPKQGQQDSYGYGHRSAGGYNHASTGAGYAGGSVATYGSEYSSYPGYEAGYGYPTSGGAYPPSASAYPPGNASYPPSGGAYPPTAGAYPPRRPYY